MKKIILISLTALLFSNCTDNTEKQTQQQEKQAKVEVAKPATPKVDLPSPLQIGMLIEKSNLEYRSGLTHDVNKASDYVTRTEKWLNFGVYSADLSYHIINEQDRNSLRYMIVVRGLGEELGLQSVFSSEELIKSFEKNLGNKDSLMFIITDIQLEFDEYAIENQLHDERIISFAGAWTEFVFLGLSVTESSKKLGTRFIEQMVVLQKIVDAMETLENPDDVTETLHTKLADLNDFFETLIDDDDIHDVSISNDEFETLKDKVNDIRYFLI